MEKGDGTERSESMQGIVDSGHQEPKDEDCITTAEEYEAYVLRPLSRHKSSNKGLTTVEVADGTAVLTPFPALEATLIEDTRHRV